MANPAHLEILKQGVKAWNGWREENVILTPCLSGADLTKANLCGADLDRAQIDNSNLSGAYLIGARFRHANLSRTSLIRANLSRADLTGADLKGADLRGASLMDMDLGRADLRGASLISASLGGAYFGGADLRGADFTDVSLSITSFIDNDLSRVKGLETVRHSAPSYLGIETVYKSQGKIPEGFLRGCGVPEDFITYVRSLTAQPIQFYSCFISYSSEDQGFAEKVHADLQARGVRVWFAPHDLPIGAKIRPAIDKSIRVYDKLLLVLSESSISSQWVEQEVETALRKERQAGGIVLFPVRLDDTVLQISEGWPALVKDTRHVGDFTRWKDHDSYQKSFERLLRDLKAGA